MAKDEEPVQMILQPSAVDILCGKDKLCVSHVGSKRFRAVIESYRHRYSLAKTKYQKMMITKEIYERLLDEGCRFLKFNGINKIWEELSSMAARDKVGHALRFANRKKSRKSGSSSSVSSTEENQSSSVERATMPGIDYTRPIPLNEIQPYQAPAYQPSYQQSQVDPSKPESKIPRTPRGRDALEPVPVTSALPGNSPVPQQESIGPDIWSIMQEKIADWDTPKPDLSTSPLAV